MRITAKRLISVLCAASSAIAVMNPTSATAAPPPTDTAHLILVVQNMQELSKRDVRDRRDVDKFLNALMARPNRPDILLLNEVADEAVRYIAKKLTSKTGVSFRAALMPPDNPLKKVRGTTDHFYITDTAVVINTQTVQKVRTGGWITTKLKASHFDRGGKASVVRGRRQGHTMLKHLPTGWLLPVMSFHLHSRGELKPGFDSTYRTKWTQQAIKFMDNKYPADSAGPQVVRRIFAGDINDLLCEKVDTWTGECKSGLHDWWKVYKNRNYLDMSPKPAWVDHAISKIEWATAHLLEGNYSNHPMLYFRVGTDDVGPTPPDGFNVSNSQNFCCWVGMKWKPAHDHGGIGVDEYEISRRTLPASAWQVVATVQFDDPWFRWDDTVDKGESYEYRARSKDKNGNWGPYSTDSVTVPN